MPRTLMGWWMRRTPSADVIKSYFHICRRRVRHIGLLWIRVRLARRTGIDSGVYG